MRRSLQEIHYLVLKENWICEMSGDLYKPIQLSSPYWSAELYCFAVLSKSNQYDSALLGILRFTSAASCCGGFVQ